MKYCRPISSTSCCSATGAERTVRTIDDTAITNKENDQSASAESYTQLVTGRENNFREPQNSDDRFAKKSHPSEFCESSGGSLYVL